MDPLLLVAAVVVAFTAFTAYATAFGKKVLERELVKLEKTKEDKTGQLQIVTKRRKSADGSCKLFRRVREEKRAALDGLVEELAEFEKGEEEAEVDEALEEEGAGDAGEVVAEGEESAAGEDAVDEGVEVSGEEVDHETGGKRIKVRGRASGEGDGDGQEHHEQDKKIKVRFPTEQRGLNQ